MTKVCEAIELLSDGKWHKVKDLQKKLELNNFKTKLMIEFLVNYNFCLLTGVNRWVQRGNLPEWETKPERIKLKPDMLTFLKELDKIEEG